MRWWLLLVVALATACDPCMPYERCAKGHTEMEYGCRPSVNWEGELELDCGFAPEFECDLWERVIPACPEGGPPTVIPLVEDTP